MGLSVIWRIMEIQEDNTKRNQVKPVIDNDQFMGISACLTERLNLTFILTPDLYIYQAQLGLKYPKAALNHHKSP